MSYIKNKRDNNEKAIIEILKARGFWESLRGGTHDGNWHARGQTFNCEIKDGARPISQRQLTPHEKQFKREVEARGVRYWILLSPDDAQALANGEYDKIVERPEYETLPFE